MAVKPSDLPDRLDENGEPVWETVAEESADVVKLDNVGDMFIGTYVGLDTITPDNGEEFSRYVFRDRWDGLKAINVSYKLETAMKDISEGDLVRITYAKDIVTKRGLNPMKDYKVERARR